MLNILLTRTKAEEGIWLNLPAAPEDLELAREWLYPASGPVEPVRIAQAQASLPELQELLAGQVLRTGQTYRELDFLAKCLDCFSEEALACLAAAAASPRVNTIPEMVNAVGNLNRYRFFPDIATTEELGRRLAESNVVRVPEHLRPYIDFERLGAEYENTHSIYRLPQGYVFYDGLPDLYHYREYDGAELPDIQIGYVFRVELQSEPYSVSGSGPYILKLPASNAALQAAQSALQTSLNECVEKNMLLQAYPTAYRKVQIVVAPVGYPTEILTIPDSLRRISGGLEGVHGPEPGRALRQTGAGLYRPNSKSQCTKLRGRLSPGVYGRAVRAGAAFTNAVRRLCQSNRFPHPA